MTAPTGAERRHTVDTATLTMTDGTEIQVRLYEGGAGPLVRVTAPLPVSVVGLRGGTPDCVVEIAVHHDPEGRS